MSKPDDPFELEEPGPVETRPPRPPETNGEPAADDVIARETARRAVVERGAAPRVEGRIEERTVDERTVAERTGRAVERVRGVRPPPPGWPVEAFVFPLRGRGAAIVAGLAAAWALLDALGATPIGFLGLILQIPLLAFLLRWHVHEAGMSAAGVDHPVGFARVLDMDASAMHAFVGTVVTAVAVGLPGFVAAFFGSWALAVFLWIAGSAWFSVTLLGAAVGDPGLRWPWRAGEWLVRRPLPFLAAALGPWALVSAQWLVFSIAGAASFVGALVACFAVRCVVVYLWLLSARAIGVAGRAWTPPWEPGPME